MTDRPDMYMVYSSLLAGMTFPMREGEVRENSKETFRVLNGRLELKTEDGWEDVSDQYETRTEEEHARCMDKAFEWLEEYKSRPKRSLL